MIAIKQCTDGFMWEIVSIETAKYIFTQKNKEVYCLYNDDSEGLAVSISDMEDHYDCGELLGIECEPQPSNKNIKRIKSFFDENGYPKKIRIYDNGGASVDRFTIVYTGNYRETTAREFYYIASSSNPSHPQGFWEHGSSDTQIDRPKYSHLGKKIKFDKLPDAVKSSLMSDYLTFWGFTDEFDKWI